MPKGSIRSRSLAVAVAMALVAPMATAGEVRVFSSPEGALVSVDGVPYGRTGSAGLLLDLPDGPAALRISKEGLAAVDKVVLVSGAAPVAVHVRLSESPAQQPAVPAAEAAAAEAPAAGDPPVAATADQPALTDPGAVADPAALVDPGAPAALGDPAAARDLPAAAPAAPRRSTVTAHFPKGIKFLGGAAFPDPGKARKTWNNRLSITEDAVLLGFVNDIYRPATIPLDAVTAVRYGQASTRHGLRWAALGVLVAPVALFGLFHKERKHNVSISWIEPDGRELGVLFQIHKDSYRDVLNALAGATGKPILAEAEEREWLAKNGVFADLDQPPAGM